jgi:hypothetical protein
MPLSTTIAPDKLTSAGPKYGVRDPRDYQALNTRCKVVLVMKKSEELQGWRTNELTLLHFRYAPSIPEFNGGMFMYFDMPPTELHLIVKGDVNHPIAQDRKPTYLAFLRRAPDGRFHPITGQYDSETSFRMSPRFRQINCRILSAPLLTIARASPHAVLAPRRCRRVLMPVQRWHLTRRWW